MNHSIEELTNQLRFKEKNSIGLAKAFQFMMKENDWTQEELSEKIDIKRSTLANYLRLLTLPENIQKSIESGIISMGHAKALLKLNDIEQQQKNFERIVRKGLSVRAAEEACSDGNNLESNVPNHFIKPLIEEIQRHLGTKVSLEQVGEKGRICIDYYNIDDLDRILMIIRGNDG